MAEEKKPNETAVVQPPKEPTKEPPKNVPKDIPKETPKAIPKEQPKVIEFAAEKAKAALVDKVSQSKSEPAKDTPAKKEPEKPKPEKKAEKAEKVPKPVDKAKVVYLKLSELHPFHTFRQHPYKVVDDDKMRELVGTIKEHGVIQPAMVRPEKNGNGYEIIAGHRRHRGSELAGVELIPCIVRNMTDVEAVMEMKNSNKQRGDPSPSEWAKLLDLEMEAIKHQGSKLAGVAAGDVGKRSAEIVGENNGMNYKKVMRYIRLNSLVPELLQMVDEKKLGFIPAVEISYIKPRNQQLIAVSIEGEQSSPSLSQAQRLRELDKSNKLTGDVIDGILSEVKKEADKVIINSAELEKYFGKEKTPREMKDQIIKLLDEWKEKQPQELIKPEKKADKEH